MATGPTGQTCKQSLLGGWPTPLKNDGVKVTWDDEIPNMGKIIQSCSKPPSRYSMWYTQIGPKYKPQFGDS
jgi:hypothetical protein